MPTDRNNFRARSASAGARVCFRAPAGSRSSRFRASRRSCAMSTISAIKSLLTQTNHIPGAFKRASRTGDEGRMASKNLAFAAAAVVLMSATVFACGKHDTTTPPSDSVDSTRHTTSMAPPTMTTVPAEGVAEAEHAVIRFVDSLGTGDLDAAAALVGPMSERQADAAGGLRSLLLQSTEGHGAWVGAHDRVVTPVGISPDLVVVVLEGTLEVEGNTERRVAAFPVRKSEVAAEWIVEPWAYEIARTPPLLVRSPEIDAEEQARVEHNETVVVTVETALAGRIWTVFDAGTPEGIVVANGQRSSQFKANAAERVVIVFDAGATLYAKAFRLVGDDAQTRPPTTVRDSPVISVPSLSQGTNQLLRSCAAGNDPSCDAAHSPGALDDRATSFIRQRCAVGDQTYCRLFDRLVDAKRRTHPEVQHK